MNAERRTQPSEEERSRIVAPKLPRACLVTTSWDDGHLEDERLALLLQEVGGAATFYIPRDGKYRQISAGVVRGLSEHFEIGAHSLTHRSLTSLALADAQAEVAGSKAYVEDQTGKPCQMFCYPYGHENAEIVFAVQGAGFLGARTVRDFCDGSGPDRFRLPTTIHACRHSVEMTTLRQPPLAAECLDDAIDLRDVQISRDGSYDWEELAIRTFEVVRRRGGVWHLWGHSWEITSCGLWSALRNVLLEVLRQPEVLAVTNAELVSTLFEAWHDPKL